MIFLNNFIEIYVMTKIILRKRIGKSNDIFFVRLPGAIFWCIIQIIAKF